MVEKVYSKEEAMSFFLTNSSGSCICVKGDEELEVDNYPVQ